MNILKESKVTYNNTHKGFFRFFGFTLFFGKRWCFIFECYVYKVGEIVFHNYFPHRAMGDATVNIYLE